MRLIHGLALLTGAFLLSIVGDASAQNREDAAANFRAADANGDAALSRDEFEVFIDRNAEAGIGRSRMVRRRGAYAIAFDRLDTDRNGVLTTQEIAAGAAR